MKVSMVRESSMHALSDIEFHNFFNRIIEVYILITNCISTFSKCVFSKYYAKKDIGQHSCCIKNDTW